MPIVITLHDKEARRYGEQLEELEDALVTALCEKGFDDYTIEDSYTGNSIRKMPEIEERQR